jgi:hypothetical protein
MGLPFEGVDALEEQQDDSSFIADDGIVEASRCLIPSNH